MRGCFRILYKEDADKLKKLFKKYPDDWQSVRGTEYSDGYDEIYYFGTVREGECRCSKEQLTVKYKWYSE